MSDLTAIGVSNVGEQCPLISHCQPQSLRTRPAITRSGLNCNQTGTVSCYMRTAYTNPTRLQPKFEEFRRDNLRTPTIPFQPHNHDPYKITRPILQQNQPNTLEPSLLLSTFTSCTGVRRVHSRLATFIYASMDGALSPWTARSVLPPEKQAGHTVRHSSILVLIQSLVLGHVEGFDDLIAMLQKSLGQTAQQFSFPLQNWSALIIHSRSPSARLDPHRRHSPPPPSPSHRGSQQSSHPRQLLPPRPVRPLARSTNCSSHRLRRRSSRSWVWRRRTCTVTAAQTRTALVRSHCSEH